MTSTKQQKFVDTVIGAKNLRNSYYGNPRFQVVLASGRVFNTAADSSVNYDVRNVLGAGSPVMITVNGRGTIDRLEDIL